MQRPTPAPRLPFPGLSGVLDKLRALEGDIERLETLQSKLARSASLWRAVATGVSVVALAEFYLLWSRP